MWNGVEEDIFEVCVRYVLLILYKGVTNVGEVGNVFSDVRIFRSVCSPEITNRVLSKKDMGRFMDGAEHFPSLHGSNATSGVHQLRVSKVHDNLCSCVSILSYPKGNIRVSFWARRPGCLANHDV